MDTEVMVQFYKTSSMMVTVLNNRLRPYHLTFQQFMILDYLARQDKEVIGKDICQYLGISHPTSVGLMSRMSGKGLLTMAVSLNDRRQTAIHITEYGRDVLKETTAIVDEVNQKILACFDSQKQFLQTLSQLEKVLK